MPTLTIKINPEYRLDLDKNKRTWNFVKGDLKKIFAALGFESNISITETESRSFIIDNQSSKISDTLEIGSDFEAFKELAITTDQTECLALVLAIAMRLQRTYRGAFIISCDYYPIVASANKLLSKSLSLKPSHNWLTTFINYPSPGRKPIKSKPLKSSEAVQRSADKKRREGKVQMKTWLDKSLRDQLAEYCKVTDSTLEKALSEILPLGLNIRTHLIKEKAGAENKAI